ncbi:xpo4 [Scenedesmus sp. PABB004]|nr:xpo4 [Scenedesmus sp. PABB004]
MASSVDDARLAVEAACAQFQNPATQAQAEAVLLQFRRSPGTLPACRHILETSGSAEARFHAACTLREAALREWASHSEAERAALRSYVLRYVLGHAGEPALGVVRAILQGTLAVLLKRGWVDADPAARAAFFQELDASAHAVGGAAAAVAALQVLEAVVSEFSLVTASALGLSWEFHETCRNQLEDGFLRQIFEHALAAARRAAAELAAAPPGSDDAAAAGAGAAAAMKLMAAVLAWDFRAGTSSAFAPASAASLAVGGRKGLPDTTQVKPGAHWGDLLLAPATTDWLVRLMPALGGGAGATPLAGAARQLVVAFCCLAGDVFPKHQLQPGGGAGGGDGGAGAPPPPPAATVAHVAQMLRLVLPWCLPARAAVQAALSGDEGQLTDGCRALAALCAGHKVSVLEAASAALQQQHGGGGGGAPGASVFAALEDLTTALLAAGGVSAASSPEPWLPDAAEMLLECWSGLLTPQCGYAMAAVPPPAAAVECATRTAAAVVDAALADAAAGAHEDADDDADAGAGAVHQEEWMARVAVLLRAAPAASFARLAELLSAKQHALAAAAGAGADPSELLEQLYWLARMAAHSLADTGVGEVALLPVAVLLAVGDEASGGAGGGAAGAAAVEALSRALLELAALCLQPAAAPVVSARLMEGAAGGAARWADTYLFPEEEPLPPALEAAFGGDAGLSALDMLVCHTLLPALVHRRSLARRVMSLPSWQTLANAFAARDPALTVHLSQKFQRALSRSMCVAAAGLDDDAAAQQYVGHLLSATVNEVASLAGNPQQLAAAAQRADAQLQVCCMLEVLRGAAAGMTLGAFPALHALFGRLLEPLLALHTAFRACAPVVALLLKLADDVVENLGIFLEAPAAREALLRWTLQLLVQYRDSNLWQVSLQTAKLLQADRAAEQCRDLRAVLQLLLHITQSDLSADEEDEARNAAAGLPMVGPPPGGGGAPPGGGADGACDTVVSRVVLVGLGIVLPLISGELLKFPKLASLYYSLLSYMLEVYPRAVAELPAEGFASLMATLEWGVAGADAVAAHCSLEGLAALARFQLASAASGAPGLGRQSAGARSVVGHFQELLLRRLLLEDTPQELVELAADALLPLLLAEQSAFGPLSASVAAAAGAHGDPRAAAAVTAALAKLGGWLQGHADQLAAGPAEGDAGGAVLRAAARQFRQQLSQTVADVRGLIRMR